MNTTTFTTVQDSAHSPDVSLEQFLGLSSLDAAEQEELLVRIGELIMESVLLRAVAELDDAQALKLREDALAADTPEKLVEVLEQHVPNIDTLIEEESTAFKEECVSLISRIHNRPPQTK
jgi:hypothetical protein